MKTIKTLTIIVLIALFGLIMYQRGCCRLDVEELSGLLEELKLENKALQDNIHARDGLLGLKDKRLTELRDSLRESEKNRTRLLYDYSRLRAKYESLSDSLLNIPADSSYRFLTTEAYPYQGHRRYPFNEPQIRAIHLTYLEKISLVDMNNNLQGQVGEMAGELKITGRIVNEQDEQILLMKQTRQDLDTIIFNQNEVIEVQDKQIKKERTGKRIWQAAFGAVVIVFSVLAVGGG